MSFNPHVTEMDLARLERVFGGVTAPAYIHNVMGEFCDASSLAFPIVRVEQTPEKYVLANYDNDRGVFDKDVLARDFGCCYVGVDLGFAEDPTEISVLREDADETLSTAARIHIGHCAYDRLAQILGQMIRAWEPAGVAIDAGGPGLPVVHLLARMCVRAMVYPVFFNAWVNWRPEGLEGGIRGYLKNLVTDAMGADMAGGRLLFSPQDTERLEQYASHTVLETATGRVTYSKGNDHIIDADRCAYFAARSHMFTSSVEPAFTGMRVDTFGAFPGDYGAPYAIKEVL